ncbi:kelch repeat-containing protein [Colletotrichum plurivorum]|uniref:Kelch repeat-containing protein n=1 Tax=Colletotrichum plurivorum TaxID=2175906 RepID=A0A8H6NPT8_9PEZI|nr:kelch repeat-containing protein [Colletotrichum plurivorum]
MRLLFNLGLLVRILPLVTATPKPLDGWETLAPIPLAPRQEHAAAALSKTTLAILGGIVPDSTGEGFNTTALFQLYDIPSGTWSRAADAPVAVNHPNLAAVNGKLYLLGGLVPAPDGAWRAFPESWVYDPDFDSWSPIAPVPAGEERGSAAVGVFGKVVYLAGGMRTLRPTGETGEQDTVAFVSAFDTETSRWVTLPRMAAFLPEGKDHAAAGVVGRKFYVLGGRKRGQRNVKDTVFVLDLENLEAGWTTSRGRMPTPRGGVVAGTLGRKVYVFGGEGNPAEGSDGIFNETEVFDTKTETWKRLAPMAVPRHGGAAVAIGDGIYHPGGGIRQGGSPVDVFDVYRPGR